MIHIENNRSGCPISTSLEIVGDSWSLIIIRDLFLQHSTFKEFMDSPEKISSNILTDRLKKLKNFELISYVVNPIDKKVKNYYLTQAGIDFFPVIFNLSMWSKKHLDMEYNTIASQWFEDTQFKTQEEVINQSIEDYINFRAELLNQNEDLSKVS